MCGIALIFNQKLNLKNNLGKILNTINHRGPDDQGTYFEDQLGIGSCRLSIFDLSSMGKMPFSDKSGRFLITYNGEIYNFLELKKKFNIKNKTKTDTEILLELYCLLGERCLDYLNGIFSFIIYDKKEKIIFCARDRMGVKPLYYYHKNDTLIICSEIKGILNIINKYNIDKDTIKTYLKTSFYELGKNTFYREIKQLQQGNKLKFSLNEKKIEISRYWKLEKKIQKKKGSDALYAELYDLVENSFKLQIRSDTEIGLNVSSGTDSQIMMKILDKLQGGQKNISANSFYFDDNEFSEKSDLENFSKSINWKVNYFKITPKDIIDNFENSFNNQDEPFPGITTIAKDLLIKRAYDNKCKVILEGQGGDDFAGGYKYIFPFFISSLYIKKKFIKIFNESLQFINKENLTLIQYFKFTYMSLKYNYSRSISADGTSSYKKDIFNAKYLDSNIDERIKDIKNECKEIEDPLKKIIYRDLFYCKLQRILRSCDRASMGNSKELRVPLLDHRIVEFFFNLKNENIIRNGNLRIFYREFYDKYFNDSKNYAPFRPKKYVSDPQSNWLKNELYEWAMEHFNSKDFRLIEFYNHDNLINYFKEFKKNKKMQNSNVFWQALCLIKFYQKIS